MKAGIIGAGALGSLFAHHFHEHLIDFVIYEKNRDAVEDIQKNGLTIVKGETSKTIKPAISSSPDILNDSDIIFLFVKSYSTAGALTDISKSIKSDSLIVSLQNGLGNVEEIRKIIDAERIIYGATTVGASKSSHSTVISGGAGVINIGCSEQGHLMKVHHLLNNAGFSSYTSDDPDYIIWHKAVINAGINPIAAILNISNGGILSDKYASELQEKIIKEAVDAAAANSIKLDYTEILNTTRDVCDKTSSNICSMLQDLRNGRKTEIESINGKLIEYGDSKGLSLTYNRSLFLLIKSMESLS
jgi:2-dehydropantoate 2-reductase